MINRLSFFAALFLLFFSFSCTDLSEDEVVIVTPEPEPFFFFSADIDSEELNYEIREVSMFEPGVFHSNDSLEIEGGCRFDYGATIGKTSDQIKPSFELQNFYNGDCDGEAAVFNQLFFSDETEYFSTTDPTSDRSVIISVEYPDGLYSSQFGPNELSEFRLVGTLENNVGDDKFQVITARFNCTLYKQDNPDDRKLLQNGEFKSTVAAVSN